MQRCDSNSGGVRGTQNRVTDTPSVIRVHHLILCQAFLETSVFLCNFDYLIISSITECAWEIMESTVEI